MYIYNKYINLYIYIYKPIIFDLHGFIVSPYFGNGFGLFRLSGHEAAKVYPDGARLRGGGGVPRGWAVDTGATGTYETRERKRYLKTFYDIFG